MPVAVEPRIAILRRPGCEGLEARLQRIRHRCVTTITGDGDSEGVDVILEIKLAHKSISISDVHVLPQLGIRTHMSRHSAVLLKLLPNRPVVP